MSHFLHFVDTDKNGKINYSEFIACSIGESALVREDNLASIFQTLDLNKDGRISVDELKTSMFNKFTLNPEQDLESQRTVIEEIMRECDKKGDGFIDYRQFLSGIMQG